MKRSANFQMLIIISLIVFVDMIVISIMNHVYGMGLRLIGQFCVVLLMEDVKMTFLF